jgi:GNAT superfamily N-acetyltransferase
VFLFHRPSKLFVPLAKLKCDRRMDIGDGEYRVDTHPRLSRDGTTVSIDASHEGLGRQLIYMHSCPFTVDYLANQQQFLPVLVDYMYDHWRALLQRMGKSREDFAGSMQARCSIGVLPTALVAFQGDEILGTVALKPQDLDIRPHLTPWLGGVFVPEKQRGRGIASLLITAMVAEAQKLRLAELYLWTPSAEHLYARQGWTVLERALYHDLQICIMHRRLPS